MRGYLAVQVAVQLVIPHSMIIPMENSLLQFFKEYPQLAVLASLAISILIAIVGLLPSVFITAANILFFGFWYGTLLSFFGEAMGAGVAFILYRKGLKQAVSKKLLKYPSIKKLIEAGNKEAFYLVFSLRLVPFVPSGIITFAAAIGRISFYTFLLASSIGKIPALLLEALSVYSVTKFEWAGKLALLVVAVLLVYWVIRKTR